nr:hypothetical protein [Acidobacteriota bacterium]
DEVSLHIESDTSSVDATLNLGNLSQPIVSQRKRVADVRVKEGEINLWDIVTQRTETRDKSGIPYLSQVPVLNRLFSNEKVEIDEQQVLTLLIPHIIRAPDIRKVNLMGISSGSDQVVRMRYGATNGPKVSADTPGPVLELPPGNAPAPVPQQSMPGAQPGMQPGSQPGLQPGQPVASAPAAKVGIARLFFSPAKVQGKVGNAFTAELTVADAGDLGESLAVVQFDPKALKLDGVSPGPVLANSGGIAAPPGQKTEEGVVVLKFGKPGASNGVIATFTFEPIIAGSSTISIPGGHAVTAGGQDINVRYEPLEVTAQ